MLRNGTETTRIRTKQVLCTWACLVPNTSAPRSDVDSVQFWLVSVKLGRKLTSTRYNSMILLLLMCICRRPMVWVLNKQLSYRLEMNCCASTLVELQLSSRYLDVFLPLSLILFSSILCTSLSCCNRLRLIHIKLLLYSMNQMSSCKGE